MQADMVLIRNLLRKHPSWGRTRLSQEICRALNWEQANGRLKERACRVVLRRLETLGFLELPERLVNNGGRPPSRVVTTIDPSPTQNLTAMPVDLVLQIVDSAPDARLWNSLVAQHHYLGLATPVGRLLRYLVFGDAQLVGAISFSEGAWRIAARDSLLEDVGISKSRVGDAVVGNNRFLILPNVSVPNLASRILSIALRRLRCDWAMRYACVPEVVETFVDPTRFAGTCYRAANWLPIASTKGFAKRGSHHTNPKAPKLMLLRGLTSQIHRKLELATRGQLTRAA